MPLDMKVMLAGSRFCARGIRSQGAWPLGLALLACLAVAGCADTATVPAPSRTPGALPAGERWMQPGQPIVLPPGGSVGASPSPGAPVIVQPVPLESIGVPASRDPAGFYHEVAAGETLSAIGRRYGVSVERLTAVNGLDDPNRIVPGQLIFVPQGG